MHDAEREKIHFDKGMEEIEATKDRERQLKQHVQMLEQEKSQLEKFERADNEEKQPSASKLDRTKEEQMMTMEQVEAFEEVFSKIEAATGEKDIDQLVKKFIEAEEKNFTLFTFVGNLLNEIETSDNQVKEMEEELENYKTKGMDKNNPK